nr:TetR/AcrR family transcriptional regulator C-terminal domain-containing protein [Nocardiopsis chromatogenes]
MNEISATAAGVMAKGEIAAPTPGARSREDTPVRCPAAPITSSTPSASAGGFSVAGAAHALSVLDGYAYGFVLQQLSLPFAAPGGAGDVAGAMPEEMPRDAYPHLAEMIGELALKPGYTYTDEFETGLELILYGLERGRESRA